MENIIEAEYKVVHERTLDIIATEIRTIDNHVCQVALQGAVEIGIRLEEAKEQVGHGNWELWCKENLDYSKSQAERFMKISAEYGDPSSPYLSAIAKTYTCTDFSISKAFRLLSVPENDVEDFAKNNDIESMTVKELEAEVKRLKEEKETGEVEELAKQLKTVELEKIKIQDELEIVRKAVMQDMADKINNPDTEQEDLKAKIELEKKDKEIEKLKNKIAKAEERAKTTAEEKEKAIEEAETKAKESAKADAEKAVEDTVKILNEIIAETEKRALAAEKKLESISNEDFVIFKVKVDNLQEIFADVLNSIDNIRVSDPQQADKLSMALAKLMEQLITRIDGVNQN